MLVFSSTWLRSCELGIGVDEAVCGEAVEAREVGIAGLGIRVEPGALLSRFFVARAPQHPHRLALIRRWRFCTADNFSRRFLRGFCLFLNRVAVHRLSLQRHQQHAMSSWPVTELQFRPQQPEPENWAIAWNHWVPRTPAMRQEKDEN